MAAGLGLRAKALYDRFMRGARSGAHNRTGAARGQETIKGFKTHQAGIGNLLRGVRDKYRGGLPGRAPGAGSTGATGRGLERAGRYITEHPFASAGYATGGILGGVWAMSDDELMDLYEEAVDQGYQGSFGEFARQFRG